MQQYIDQALFDTGILVLAAQGVLKREKSSFDIEEALNFEGVLNTYQAIRPSDHLYVPQTRDALTWLINSNLIDFEVEQFSNLLKTAASFRMQLNAEMKPPSFKERVFRGAIFQSESNAYLNRVAQAKLNISSILIQVSPPHERVNSNFPLFEKKLRAPILQKFIAQAVDLLERTAGKNLREPVDPKIKFHFGCHIGASCFWSVLKRFENFPLYAPTVTPRTLSEELVAALKLMYSPVVDPQDIPSFFEFYLSHVVDAGNELKVKSEEDLWSRIPFDITSSVLYSDMENEMLGFFEGIDDQIDSCDFMDAMDASPVKMGFHFLNSV
jgi:hypothetical protein